MKVYKVWIVDQVIMQCNGFPSIYILLFSFLISLVLFCFVLFCFVLFCFVLFCYVMLCYVMLCYVMLWNSVKRDDAGKPNLMI